MPTVSMRQLLEAGVHFGHQTRRWNPKMRPFIFAERNGIHIIDLAQTVKRLDLALDAIRETTARGEQVLFVGTKKQAQEPIIQESERAGQPYVTSRWLGSMLTNFVTIKKRLGLLEQLEARQINGDFDRLSKKEAAVLSEELRKLKLSLGGIRKMRRLPGAVFIIDPARERIAVAECIKLEIPIIGTGDTNVDPDELDYIIPANDDAIRAIRLLCQLIADACVEGQQERSARTAPEPEQPEAEAELSVEEAVQPVEEIEQPEAEPEQPVDEVLQEPAEELSQEPEPAAPTAEEIVPEQPAEPFEEVGEVSAEEDLVSTTPAWMEGEVNVITANVADFIDSGAPAAEPPQPPSAEVEEPVESQPEQIVEEAAEAPVAGAEVVEPDVPEPAESEPEVEPATEPTGWQDEAEEASEQAPIEPAVAAPDEAARSAKRPDKQYQLVLRLVDGDRISIGIFASVDEAQGQAAEVVKQFAEVKEGSWPFVGGRFLRPDTIVSIDVEEEHDTGWGGSNARRMFGGEGE